MLQGNISVKHKSPVADRVVLDELIASKSLLDQTSTCINKVYKSKHKAHVSKAVTTRVPEVQEIAQYSPKHNKSTKGNLDTLQIEIRPKEHVKNLNCQRSILILKEDQSCTRDTKTDDSKYETSTEKDRMIEMEIEMNNLREQLVNLKDENQSLRNILSDYEQTKTQESLLLTQVNSLTSLTTSLQSQQYSTLAKLKEANKAISNLEKENNNLVREKEDSETQLRLLKEALNKRNEDIKEIEANNEELVGLLEK